jgi:hypothetical protein
LVDVLVQFAVFPARVQSVFVVVVCAVAWCDAESEIKAVASIQGNMRIVFSPESLYEGIIGMSI